MIPAAPVQAAALADHVGGTLVGPDRTIHGVAPLADARPDTLTFSDRAIPRHSMAGVVLATAPSPGRTVVVVTDPRAAFLAALDWMFPTPPAAGVMPGSHVHPTVTVGANVTIHPGAVVGAHCEIGDGTVVFANAVLYPHTQLGRDVRVHSGAVLGADGFSYHPGTNGPRKMQHLGRVVVHDGVEIGANTCIDRGALSDTVVGQHTKLDNLVQVGHNSQLGAGVLVAGQAGLSGSVVIADGAVLGGQVGVAEHRRIGAYAQVGAQSGVSRDVPPSATVLGTPARSARRTRRVWAVLQRLLELAAEVRENRRRVAVLDDSDE